MREGLAAGFLFLTLGGVPSAQAGVITSFEGALQPGGPAPGWAYLWNGGGAIGNSANYAALLPTGDPVYWYDSDGVPGVPGAEPAGYVYFGSAGGFALGHPGRGFAQPEGLGGPSRFAIAAYTVGQSGHFLLTDSGLTNRDASQTGLDLEVYVNNTLVASGVTAPGFGSSLGFDTDLGSLNAGDTIYVAVGPRFVDYNDTFALRYSITVPEPGTALLAGLGLLAFGFARRPV